MQFHMPVKLYFGPGEIQNLTKILTQDLKANAPIIVTDKGIVASGLVGIVIQMLPGIRVYDTIEANPKSDTINNIARELRQIKPDLIIGLGGGSPLDAVKVLALLATNDGPIEAF